MNDLVLDDLKSVIISGLKRKSITKCSQWACNYRVMGKPFDGPWTFKRFPWLIEIHDFKETSACVQKAAQMGFTETALNICFYHIDIVKVNVLYILPTSKPMAANFSSSRFDPALEESEHLQKLFTDVKNVNHKRSGSASLFIRGSNNRAGLKSDPISIIIYDEKDEMNQDNIALAGERLAGQDYYKEYKLSTPTIDGFGINGDYQISTQDHFFFRCPHCSKQIELKYPESFQICGEDINDPDVDKSYIKCYECGVKLDHEDKINFLNTGEWVSSYPDRYEKGYYINQFYSMNDYCHPRNLARHYMRGLYDPTFEQEFYNSKLGLPHIVGDAKLTLENINDCLSNYKAGTKRFSNIRTMGVDPGKVIHYEICDWKIDSTANINDINLLSTPYVIKEGFVHEFEDLDDLINKFKVIYTVVDGNHEKRKAIELCRRFEGHVKLCYYTYSRGSKDIVSSTSNNSSNDFVTVDRTAWMDLALGRFLKKNIYLPLDISKEYRDHLQRPVKVPKLDKNGRNSTVFITPPNKADHLAHARTYNEIALKLLIGAFGSVTNITNIY